MLMKSTNHEGCSLFADINNITAIVDKLSFPAKYIRVKADVALRDVHSAMNQYFFLKRTRVIYDILISNSYIV